ncbi:LOW QUALITY PROTEIN: uncharacterized protein LOC113795899 [Dermatophagoides pteronyssinus]|uniref:LOW QUALITY PROTEIN: uncharacterized protein LOC113795899 n=1 Tax=Dermatophagoides pteronyssinus TaxID=6956 RepID=UPI003F667D2A
MFGYGFSNRDFRPQDYGIVFFLSFLGAFILVFITSFMFGMRDFRIFFKCIFKNPRLFFFIFRRLRLLFNHKIQFHIVRKLMPGKRIDEFRPSIEQVKRNVIGFEIYKEILENGRHTILLCLIELRLLYLRRRFEKENIGFSTLNRYGREKRVKDLVKDIINRFGHSVGRGQPNIEHLTRAQQLDPKLEQKMVYILSQPGIEAKYLQTGFNWGRKLILRIKKQMNRPNVQ